MYELHLPNLAVQSAARLALRWLQSNLALLLVRSKKLQLSCPALERRVRCTCKKASLVGAAAGRLANATVQCFHVKPYNPPSNHV